MELPVAYRERMKDLLGSEYPAYIASLDDPRLYGLRVNTSKISVEEFEKITPFPIRRIPYIPNGFFYDGEIYQPAKHPYYFAGLYYLQDPSAMTPASRLPIESGDRVLDICAAPGGKSTELAARLHSTITSGLLVANDISASRAKALQKNIELFGIPNSLITTEYPEKLSEYFPGYFDKILIDAPCSGEGMFRKDPAMIRSWSEDSSEKYAALQEDIVRYAIRMLKPGGYMLYSTCTFSPLEDEGTVEKILAMDESLELVPIQGEGFAPGFTDWRQRVSHYENVSPRPDIDDIPYENCGRIFPHRMQGEGHFLALFHKKYRGQNDKLLHPELSDNTCEYSDRVNKNTRSAQYLLNKEEQIIWSEFSSALRVVIPMDQIESHDGKLYLCVDELPDVKGLRFIRNGLYLGECKKNRFESSQALAMALRMEDYDNVWNLPADDDRVVRYLKGETIRVAEEDSYLCGDEQADDGIVLICVDGFPLGWGKKTGQVVKNKYHSGWRLM